MPTIDVDGRVYPCMQNVVEYILELRVAVDTLEAVCRILELDTETCTGMDILHAVALVQVREQQLT